ASVLPSDATEVLLFLFLLDLALAMDGKSVVLDADINVFFVNARNFNFQSDVVLVFVDVHRRCKAGGCQRLFRAFGAIGLTEKTVHTAHAVLHCRKLTERIPTGQYCHKSSSFRGGTLRGKNFRWADLVQRTCKSKKRCSLNVDTRLVRYRCQATAGYLSLAHDM